MGDGRAAGLNPIDPTLEEDTITFHEPLHYMDEAPGPFFIAKTLRTHIFRFVGPTTIMIHVFWVVLSLRGLPG